MPLKDIDSTEITCLVDNNVDILLPNTKVAFRPSLNHSKKYKEIVDYFVDKLDDTGIKPVLMEYEKWSRKGNPNWIWIRDKIKKCNALFLILSKNIVKRTYTQNWVAFEIGLPQQLKYLSLSLRKRTSIFLSHMPVIILMRGLSLNKICFECLYLLGTIGRSFW